MNISTIYKVFDMVVSLIDTKRKGADEPASGVSQRPASTLADQVEARLTNVVVAALKEAFDRDHARLELERSHLDEQRRRAEENMRVELQRQAIDREISRLRLLAVAGLVGWMASVGLFVMRGQQIAGPSRAVLITASVLLLGSVGAAFTAQSQTGAHIRESDGQLKTPAGIACLWLLLGGLALAAGSLF